ncbi:MAG: ATP-binding cassette domain-containing protein [Actinobacteria bacterium]|nr:ATP-binding cassette domain-containing protein [Actinomycetota bacterium]
MITCRNQQGREGWNPRRPRKEGGRCTRFHQVGCVPCRRQRGCAGRFGRQVTLVEEELERGGTVNNGPTSSIWLKEIRKSYGATVALDGVTLGVQPGEVHALLGENGAGKTTLMKTLFGLTQPDSGHIEVDGVPTVISTPRDARAVGIGMVTQHFSLVKTMTVAENLALANTRLIRVDIEGARKTAQSANERFGLDVPTDSIVSELPVALQQRVESARSA